MLPPISDTSPSIKLLENFIWSDLFFASNCSILLSEISYVSSLKLNSDDIFNIFLKYNILLRKMTSYRIKNSLRVSIGNDKENKKFLKVLESKI